MPAVASIHFHGSSFHTRNGIVVREDCHGIVEQGVFVATGMLIETKADVEPALREAIRLKDRTVFMDFQTDPEENVWPMVQAGKGITEMLLGSEDL